MIHDADQFTFTSIVFLKNLVGGDGVFPSEEAERCVNLDKKNEPAFYHTYSFNSISSSRYWVNID